MPDYNRAAAAFWWTLSVLGAAVIATAVTRFARSADVETALQLVLCTAMAMIAGSMPIRVPGSRNAFSASELFLFLLLLLAGVDAAVIAAAADAAVATWRLSRRWTSRIASPAMSAVAMVVPAMLLQAALRAAESAGWPHEVLVLPALMVFALLYFVVNTALVTALPRLNKGEGPASLRLFDEHRWLALAYLANAAVAGFLHQGFRQTGIAAVITAIPVIAVLLSASHYHFRRKEAENQLKQAQLAEAERTRLHLEALQSSERRFHSAFTHASIGMALVSPDGRVRQVNAALRELFGLPDEGALRLDFAHFRERDDGATLAELLRPLCQGRTDRLSAELRWPHPAGHDVWVSVNCSHFSEPGDSEPCLILQVQDVSARREAEAQLHHFAFHDSLTNLPNRLRLHEAIARALDRARRDERAAFGVLFIDLDRFKLVNDGMGHAVGDDFLREVARRIRRTLRAEDMVARLGGDEFAILAVRGAAAAEQVVALAERVQEALRRPLRLRNTDITTSASIGIALSAPHYQTPDELLRDADIAMYKAKALGKARHAVFDRSLHEQLFDRLRLESELRKALDEGTMEVAYQPLFALASAELVGFEALARWNHPQLGRIGPDAFVPVAEESGAIIQLTEFVLRTACADLRRWQLLHPRLAQLKMHVNVAAKDLAGAQLVARVTHALVNARLRPGDLSIELTENILMESLEAALGSLDELHRLGIGLSVDDFGTGYSSLAHLSTLPIDSLKIDRSFVRNLRPQSKEAAVIRAIVNLGSSLGKQVIAEGIETPAQLDELRALGCDVGQGYHLGRPEAAARIDAWLGERLNAAAANDAAHPESTAAA